MERPKLPFAQIKREVSVEAVAKRYGFDLKPDGKKGLYGECRLPTHQSKKSKTSFYVNEARDYWCCHSDSCKANRGGILGGDVITLARWIFNCEEYDAAKKLMEDFHVGTFDPPAKVQAKPLPEKKPFLVEAAEKKTEPESQEAEATAINAPLKFQGFKEVDHAHQYLVRRGIRPETAKAFGVGFYGGKSSVIKDPYRIVIPIHNTKGELVGYCGRATGDEKPKYKFPIGFHKNMELFNFHRIGEQVETVVIVEGFFSVLWLTQCGFPNVIALMGHSISEEQLALLHWEKVVLMLDCWEGGADVRTQTTLRIASRCFVHSVELPKDKQPDNLTHKQLNELLGPLVR